MKLSKILLLPVLAAAIVANPRAAAASGPAPPAIADAATLTAADTSCPSADFCMVVGSYNPDANSQRAFVLTRTSAGWSSNLLTPQENYDHARLTTVFCVSNNYCWAFGWHSYANNAATSWAELYTNGHWQQIAVSAMSGAFINNVACSSVHFCMAVGAQNSPDIQTYGRVYIFNGSSWQRQVATQTNQFGQLGDVTCLGDEQCVVVGSSSAPSSPHYIVASYNSGYWAVDPSFKSGLSGGFNRVSCTALNDCMILGNDGVTGGKVFLHWDHGFWSGTDQPSSHNHVWLAMSCMHQACKLVGRLPQDGDDATTVHAIIDQSPNNIWATQVVEPNGKFGSKPKHEPASSLNSLACQASFCLAIGNYYTDGRTKLYAATNLGDNWSIEDPLAPAPNSSAGLPGSPSRSIGIFKPPNKPTDFKMPKPPAEGYDYVAIGDSITTGYSIPSCIPDVQYSPWGCQPELSPARPYPDRIAYKLGLGFTDSPLAMVNAHSTPALMRLGAWGYTVQQAAQAKSKGQKQSPWPGQLVTAEQAHSLVTGALGINDLRFSDVAMWVKRYLQPGNKVQRALDTILKQRSSDFDVMFRSLAKARQNGAKVVITLYYNPYDSPDPVCYNLRQLSGQIVNSLDAELRARAQKAGLMVADFRPAFVGHGAGTAHTFVFGNQCKLTTAAADWLPKWLNGGGGKPTVAEGFDPHPNSEGTAAMANTILEALKR